MTCHNCKDFKQQIASLEKENLELYERCQVYEEAMYLAVMNDDNLKLMKIVEDGVSKI